MPGHRSTYLAQRREADRKRKAEARAAAKDLGIPDKGLVDHAIAEAVAFSITHADRRIWSNAHAWSPINAANIYAIAMDVLVHQHRKDPIHSKAALDRRLGPQQAHEALGFIPSINPAIGQPIYRLSAPLDVSPPRMPALPLRHQDTSKSVERVQH